MERPQGLQASAEDRRTALEATKINAESLEEITVFISEAAANDSVGPDALQAIKAKIKAYHDRFGAKKTEQLLFATYKQLRAIRRQGLLQDEEARFRAEELVHLIFEGEVH